MSTGSREKGSFEPGWMLPSEKLLTQRLGKSFAQRLQVYVTKEAAPGGEDSPRHGAGGSFWRGRRSVGRAQRVCVRGNQKTATDTVAADDARRMCRIVHGLMKWERGSTRRWMADMKEGAMHGRSRKRDALTVSASTPRADSVLHPNATAHRPPAKLVDATSPRSSTNSHRSPAKDARQFSCTHSATRRPSESKSTNN